MNVDEMVKKFRLRKGPYRGDVSALCLISPRGSLGRRRLLLAGTGPHVLLYDLLTGSLVNSIVPFDGVRVHGICCGSVQEIDPMSSKKESRLSTVLVHGERRVKVLELVHTQSGEEILLKPWRSLPRFCHWIMDVRLLVSTEAKLHHGKEGAEEVMLLAVGLSNNTICLWDLSNSVFLYRVTCSERLLLYSMRLWGDSPGNLHAAVGTIFNEVLVWKLGPQAMAVEDVSRRLTLLRKRAEEGEQVLGEFLSSERVSIVEEVVEPLQTLLGHEGSIYRLTWSTDGLTLVSVSDDRSARVWHGGGREQPFSSQWEAPVRVGPILYGHGARLWDSHVEEKLLITASEDCTCRVWTTDGKYLATLKGHQGRGIWRCVYDPEMNVVVTAGADSSIKIQSLDKWSKGCDIIHSDEHIDSTARGSQSKQEIFTIDPVWSDNFAKRSGYLDSKSEYVRCLKLTNECSLYVGTNQGYVYHVQISENQETVWTTLVSSLGAPVVCMDVFLLDKRSDNLNDGENHPNEDLVIVGDGKGSATAIRARTEAQQQCTWRYTWPAEKERHLLEVFWPRTLEGRYVITADPKGSFLLWRLPSSYICHGESTGNPSSPSLTDATKENLTEAEESAVLLAKGKCAYGRVVCMDVCVDQQLLACGDKQGSVTIFSFPRTLLNHAGCVEQPLELQTLAVFRGAHGISTVTSISFISRQLGEQADIRTTGRDGCVCKFHLGSHSAAENAPQTLTCTGIERVAAVSMIERVEHSGGDSMRTDHRRKVAVGFTGSDFLLWNMTHNNELLRVTCGGWRRPFSYVLGSVPDIQHAFVFVKGQAIQIHRSWFNSSEAALSKADYERATQSLRAQFHGREINSVLIFSSSTIAGASVPGNQSLTIATGAEDGTVILSSYQEGTVEHLDPYLVLGDHVGGSAVRSLALVDRVHTLGTPTYANNSQTVIEDPLSGVAVQSCESCNFLFSAGAKEVLTCWRLLWNPEGIESRADQVPPLADEKLEERTVPKSCKVSSQWLSTRMLQKKRPPTASGDTEDDLLEPAPMSSLVRRLTLQDEDLKEKRTAASKMDDDDHRYLAMTAFAVICPRTRNLVCFIVTASSNATLTVHAFHIATRSWMEVATLDYQGAPVLSIEHIVAPCSTVPGCGNTYMVLTGATNGNIAMWDLTTTVVQYMNLGGALGVKEAVWSVLRPLTGRGSQGGRRRKTREELKLAKKSKTKLAKEPDNEIPESESTENVTYSARDNRLSAETNSSSSYYSSEREPRDQNAVLEKTSPSPTLSLIQEIEAAHQSGVNCMSVARLQLPAEVHSNSAEFVYIVISGGDDQAIQLAAIKLVPRTCPLIEDTEGRERPEDNQERGEKFFDLKFLSQKKIPCAHNSALKGIWTDGSWVFSTGLDQRLRCWKVTPEFSKELMNLDNSNTGQVTESTVSPLVECMTCVIDTPEAASLHVDASSQGKYRIAAVGRGLQVINFDSTMTSQ
ncbi:hypothetical protein R1flu_016663 [Riccia fluitans]|uniref:WD repeat-containing protein 6 n=1 Tax=Riccia fluitans TaxID=41844 RepID=A0ABD1YQJ5_9MARC